MSLPEPLPKDRCAKAHCGFLETLYARTSLPNKEAQAFYEPKYSLRIALQLAPSTSSFSSR